MKATITIEIEGSKDEIDSISNRISKFIGSEKNMKKKPIVNMFPRGYSQQRRW